MVHAAVTRAVRGTEDQQSVIHIKNVVWVQPIVADGQPVQVDISLHPQQDGEIAFAIYTEAEDAHNNRKIHCQGSASIRGAGDLPVQDISVLRDQCSLSTLSHDQCYELFKAIGIDYGPGFQGIDRLYIGRNQALAEISCLLV
ncbi:polyketide synthase dehydratase domain-containing protein [Bacillus stercoris]|nr:polyketide synthase dehydratase domain-containing protein [Bacillus stercoris]